eukprot:3050245-Amphidinium_carterae.1
MATMYFVIWMVLDESHGNVSQRFQRVMLGNSDPHVQARTVTLCRSVRTLFFPDHRREALSRRLSKIAQEKRKDVPCKALQAVHLPTLAQAAAKKQRKKTPLVPPSVGALARPVCMASGGKKPASLHLDFLLELAAVLSLEVREAVQYVLSIYVLPDHKQDNAGPHIASRRHDAPHADEGQF